MSSSEGAALSAVSSRGFLFLDAESVAPDYRIVLPPLPRGVSVINTCFLHCDVSGRPYRVEDFRAALETVGVLADTLCLGSYQMNHLWIVTMKTAETKRKLLAARELLVKGKKCYVLDPNQAAVRLKVHWVSHHVPDDSLRKALEGFGRVDEVTRDFWRVAGFEHIESTTRIVRMTMKPGVNIECLPHQLQLSGGTALVVVPGRAPLCLRCRRSGHVRKDCTVPKCDACRNFGHTAEECVPTYATATIGAAVPSSSEHFMDEVEAEAASASVDNSNTKEVRSLPEQTLSSEPAQEGSDDLSAKADTVELRASTDTATTEPEVTAAVPQPEVSGVAVKTAKKAEKTARTTRRRTSSTVSQESVDMAVQASIASKRTLDLESSPSPALGFGQLGKVALLKKGRYNPPPNIPKEPRKKTTN